jgi:hypothetical protein
LMTKECARGIVRRGRSEGDGEVFERGAEEGVELIGCTLTMSYHR